MLDLILKQVPCVVNRHTTLWSPINLGYIWQIDTKLPVTPKGGSLTQPFALRGFSQRVSTFYETSKGLARTETGIRTDTSAGASVRTYRDRSKQRSRLKDREIRDNTQAYRLSSCGKSPPRRLRPGKRRIGKDFQLGTSTGSPFRDETFLDPKSQKVLWISREEEPDGCACRELQEELGVNVEELETPIVNDDNTHISYFVRASVCNALESSTTCPENREWYWGIDNKSKKVMSVIFGPRAEVEELMRSICFVRPSTDAPWSIVAYPVGLAIRAIRYAERTTITSGKKRNVYDPFRLSDLSAGAGAEAVAGAGAGVEAEATVLETTLDSDEVKEMDPADIEISRYIPCMTPEVISRFEELAQDDMWILGIRYAVEVDEES